MVPLSTTEHARHIESMYLILFFQFMPVLREKGPWAASVQIFGCGLNTTQSTCLSHKIIMLKNAAMFYECCLAYSLSTINQHSQ